jgi:hypothetical protein
MEKAAASDGEVKRSSEIVGHLGHGSSRNRSIPGACGFSLLSQAFDGPAVAVIASK